jgi:hypothetical protein
MDVILFVLMPRQETPDVPGQFVPADLLLLLLLLLLCSCGCVL